MKEKMKKHYEKPSMLVYQFQNRTMLLAGSPTMTINEDTTGDQW